MTSVVGALSAHHRIRRKGFTNSQKFVAQANYIFPVTVVISGINFIKSSISSSQGQKDIEPAISDLEAPAVKDTTVTPAFKGKNVLSLIIYSYQGAMSPDRPQWLISGISTGEGKSCHEKRYVAVQRANIGSQIAPVLHGPGSFSLNFARS